MNLNIIFFLAKKYLSKNSSQSFWKMIKINFISVLISGCALSLIIGINKSFEKSACDSILNCYPSILIKSMKNETLNKKLLNEKILNKYKEKMRSIVFISQKDILLTCKTGDTTIAVFLKGINFKENSSYFDNKKIEKISNIKNMNSNSIIIGKGIAKTLSLKLNDKCKILYSNNDNFNKDEISFSSKKVIISGIVETGIMEFDESIVVASNEIDDIFQNETNAIELFAKPNIDIKLITEQLKKETNLEIISVYDLNSAFFEAINIERYAIFLIIFLIIIITSINTIGLLFMLITNKKADISLLLSLKFSLIQIRTLFATIALIVNFISAFLGIIFAYLISFLINQFDLIQLPENVYFTDQLSIDLSIITSIKIIILMMIISFFCSLYAIKTIKQSQINSLIKSQV